VHFAGLFTAKVEKPQSRSQQQPNEGSSSSSSSSMQQLDSMHDEEHLEAQYQVASSTTAEINNYFSWAKDLNSYSMYTAVCIFHARAIAT
jgi:hypothetical protein